jgi:hypothetical protein
MDRTEQQVPDVDVSHKLMDEWISKVCDGVKTLLNMRQQHYGNTIGEPVRVCSSAGPRERVAVYVDQKLSRAAKGDQGTIEDSEADIIGFLVLKRALAYGQGKKFSDPLDLYIKYNDTRDEKLLEPAARFAHEKAGNGLQYDQVAPSEYD